MLPPLYLLLLRNFYFLDPGQEAGPIIIPHKEIQATGNPLIMIGTLSNLNLNSYEIKNKKAKK